MEDRVSKLAALVAAYKPLIVESRTEGMWNCTYPDLPGVIASGKTPNEALKIGRKKAGIWITEMEKLGMPVPGPGDHKQFSGRLKLRVPKALHLLISKFAEINDVSMNEAVNFLIWEGLPNIAGEDKGEFYDCSIANDWIAAGLMKYNRSYSDSSEYSGQWMQRFEPQLHFMLFIFAKHQQVSMNMAATMLLAKGIGRREAEDMAGNGDGGVRKASGANSGRHREVAATAVAEDQEPQRERAFA